MTGTAGSQRNANLERPGPHCADIGSSQRMDTVCTIVVNELVFLKECFVFERGLYWRKYGRQNGRSNYLWPDL